MVSKTHLEISKELCGTVVNLSDGYAEVALITTSVMSADERGLVHGGFIFGAADYAAMLAVNDPLVVLGSAETKFLKPVRVGETVTVRAKTESESGKKRVVSAEAFRGEDLVFSGTFVCFVLDKHVLG